MTISPEEEYSVDFFTDRHRRILSSTEKMMGFLLSKLPMVKSIADFGCGPGEWLHVAEKRHIEDTLGIEGKWLQAVPQKYFKGEMMYADLERSVSLRRKYDLALSLEVAEHLTPKRAESFIADLCNSSDIVLFSAAIKGQGGPSHLNEQPQSYWRNIFAKNGYEALDVMRAPFWQDADILPYYAQNTVLYVKKDRLANIQEQFEGCVAMPEFDMRHPYLSIIDPRILAAAYKRDGVGVNTPTIRHRGA